MRNVTRIYRHVPNPHVPCCDESEMILAISILDPFQASGRTLRARALCVAPRFTFSRMEVSL